MTDINRSARRHPFRWGGDLAPTALAVRGWPSTSGNDGLARVEQLKRRVAELEQANRDLGAFAADVAHDLRAPLQAVSGFAELLTRREGARLDETSQSFVAHILSAAEGMRELVESVLEFRQSSSVVPTANRVACTDLVTGALRRLQSEIDQAGAEVGVGELPTVSADRVQLGRVFQNLLSNALKAVPPGTTPVIAVTARRVTDAWEFSVTDNGTGVPAKDRARIFELFQQGAAGARGGTGHGMGLAICRTIVGRHGGRIGVEKAPGGGSRFSFTLPVRPNRVCG